MLNARENRRKNPRCDYAETQARRESFVLAVKHWSFSYSSDR